MKIVQALRVAACVFAGTTFSSDGFPAHLRQADRPAASVATPQAPRSDQEDGYDKLLTVRRISDTAIVVTVAWGDTTNIVALKSARGVSEPNRYFVLHLEIDTYAYRLMNSGRLDEALKIFTVLAEHFPEDWQSFDSLGEVQLKLGQTKLAAESFRKSLALDPSNQNAIEKLKSLEKK